MFTSVLTLTFLVATKNVSHQRGVGLDSRRFNRKVIEEVLRFQDISFSANQANAEVSLCTTTFNI